MTGRSSHELVALLDADVIDGWRLAKIHADQTGVRLHYDRGPASVSMHIAPTADAEAGFVHSRSVRLSHGRLPVDDAAGALELIETIGQRLVACDDGQVAGMVARARRGFAGGDAERLARQLRALGLIDEVGGPAERLVDAVVEQIREGRLPVWVVEPSFRAGDAAPRLTVNVTLGGAGEHGRRDLDAVHQALRATAGAVGLAAWIEHEAWRHWWRQDDHHVYVGVAGGARPRVKLYAHADEADPAALAALVRAVGVDVPVDTAHMIAVDVDAADGEVVGVKRYSRAEPGVAAQPLVAFLATRRLVAQGWIRCERFDRAGTPLETSWHARVDVAADDASAWLGTGFYPGAVKGLVDGVIAGRVLSTDGAARTLYTAMVRP